MKTISIDFDGVIHSYTSKWTNAANISDPPVPGAMHFLKALVDSGEWDVCIFSTRNFESAAVLAMREFLYEHGDPDDRPDKSDWISKIRFPTEKPKAFVGLDDRILTFKGTFPSLEELANFKPWNKQ